MGAVCVATPSVLDSNVEPQGCDIGSDLWSVGMILPYIIALKGCKNHKIFI